MILGSKANFILVQFGIIFSFALLILFWTMGNKAFSQAKLVTFEDIKLISPKAKDEFVQAFIDAEDSFEEAGINTRLRMAHFIAQVMTETGGLKRIDEDMNYSYKSLMRVFSRRVVSEGKAREIAGKPNAVANWVYRKRLGNGDFDTGDGWSYRGSGFIQLTGRENFRLRGREVGLNLEANPELGRQAREGLMAAIAYWKARNINAAADNNDLKRVRILVNGPAAHGLPQSKEFFKRTWTEVFRGKASQGFELTENIETEAMVQDEADIFNEMLQESGLLSEDANEAGSETAAREEALKAFQNELGLPETGVLDEATKEELLDPREWRHRDEATIAPTDYESDYEQTVSFNLESIGNLAKTRVDVKEIEPHTGSGKPVDDPNIAPADQAALSESSGMYAKYELGDGSVKLETFQPFSIIGNDDRKPVTDTTGYPARAIVQILFRSDSGSEHLCSGALVSKDTVLTAAHCLHSGTVIGRPYRDFRVFPGRNEDGAPFGRCLGRASYVLRGWTASMTSDESRYYDLGALKLDCSIGEVTGWLGVRALDDDEIGLATTVHGYTGRKPPPGQQWVSEDSVRLLWELKGFYLSDTFGGTSGSPVYGTKAINVLIGVHTNGLHGAEAPWRTHNAFTRITPERLARIRDWIAH